MPAVIELADAFEKHEKTREFTKKLGLLYKHYAGRPIPLFFAENLTKMCKGAKIYLKREDLAHTGAHKINNTLGQALLAETMGKKKLIAETGAGQHGVATATATALFNMECSISNPSADGPVIQKASKRALEKGVTLEDVLEMSGRIREKSQIPIIIFTYYNPVLAMGGQKFCRKAVENGVDGVLIVDLPFEESK